MALFHHEIRLLDRFHCPTPASAAPCNRRSQRLSPAEAMHTPHVEVDLRLCTSGTYVDRTVVNGYAAHAPDAPVMLGVRQREAFLRGMEATCAAGAPRLRAVLGAGAIGATAAALVITAAALVGAYLGFVAGAWALAHLATVALGCAVVGAATLAAMEARDWSRLHDLLTRLEVLSCAVEREVVGHSGAYVPRAVDQRALNEAMVSDAWALQQAAMELSNPYEDEARRMQREADEHVRMAA